MPVTSKTENRKRKQDTVNDTIKGSNEPTNPRPSKKAKPDVRAKQSFNKESTSGVKRSSINAEIDDESNPHPAKKTKIGSGIKNSSLSSDTKSDGEAGKRVVRGRPEQDHGGKKCCNTCQAWKDLAEFAPKKHSKAPGATVGYCLRCQANKHAKNKAKAEAKRGEAQKNKAATSTDIDDEIEDESDDDKLDMNKTLDEISVDTEG
jgi:hypothetical protein